MGPVVADTHAIIWYIFADPSLSAQARDALRAANQGPDAIYVPSICLVEAIYLAEKGKIRAEVPERLTLTLSDPTQESEWLPSMKKLPWP